MKETKTSDIKANDKKPAKKPKHFSAMLAAAVFHCPTARVDAHHNILYNNGTSVTYEEKR